MSESFSLFDPIHRGDEKRKCSPGIGVYAAFTAELLDERTVDDLKIQTEFFTHFTFPIRHIRSRSDNQNVTGAVPQQKFLNNQPGLDGFSQTWKRSGSVPKKSLINAQYLPIFETSPTILKIAVCKLLNRETVAKPPIFRGSLTLNWALMSLSSYLLTEMGNAA